jgi:hypothetical protein
MSTVVLRLFCAFNGWERFSRVSEQRGFGPELLDANLPRAMKPSGVYHKQITTETSPGWWRER